MIADLRYVTDASVALKWFLTEEFMEGARRLAFGSAVLLVPELFASEYANVLLKVCRRGVIATADAVAIHKLAMRRVTFAAAVPLSALALEIAIDSGISAYDATYVALSETTGAPLVTADRRLFEAVSSSRGLDVRWVGDL